jgi:hypothetical protein
MLRRLVHFLRSLLTRTESDQQNASQQNSADTETGERDVFSYG